MAAFVIGGVLAVGGSYLIVVKGVKQGPFPADGVIPFLKPLAYYGWAVGLASALLVYALLSLSGRQYQEPGRMNRGPADAHAPHRQGATSAGPAPGARQYPAYSPTRLPLPAALPGKGPLIWDGGPFRSFGGLPC